MVVAVVLALAGCATPRPTPVPPGSPSATPTGAPGVTPKGAPGVTPKGAPGVVATPSAPSAGWQLVQLPDAGDVGSIADIATLPGRIVAAAAAGAAGERSVAWSSVDHGATWVAEPRPGGARSLGRLIAWGDRVLAIGEGDSGCAHPSVVQVQVRDAGGEWAAAPFDPIFCAGGMPQAAASGTHAVIVGAGTGDVAYAWSSEDGLHWTDRSSVFVDRFPQGVAVDGSGFIAFGTYLDRRPAWVARSVDGTAWQGPRPMPGLAGATVVGNPVTLDGQVAVFAGDSNGAVWLIQPDGSGGWRSQLTLGLTRTTLSRIVAVGGGLVALGGDDGGPVAWVSSDGVSWRPLTLPREAIASGPNATLTGAAVADGRAYLVGQIVAAAGDRAIGALWTGPASLLE